MRDFWNQSFFSLRDEVPIHCALCRFVAGSHAKHHDSSLVIIFFRKLLSTLIISRRFVHDSTRWFRCSPIKACSTKRAQIFFFFRSLCKIRRMIVFGMWGVHLSCASVPAYLLVTCYLRALFALFRVDAGRPLRSSSSTDSRPLRKRLNHSKTVVRFKECSPHTFCNFSSVSLTEHQAL